MKGIKRRGFKSALREGERISLSWRARDDSKDEVICRWWKL